jgi:hypothetical protein
MSRALLFESGDLADVRVRIVKIGEIVFPYESDVLFYFLRLEDEEHLAGLEVAQLQYKMYLGVDEMQFPQHRFLRRREQKKYSARSSCVKRGRP